MAEMYRNSFVYGKMVQQFLFTWKTQYHLK